MNGPFIVRSVPRIHPGKADAYQPVAADFCAEQRELMERDEFYLASTQFCFTAKKSAETDVQLGA